MLEKHYSGDNSHEFWKGVNSAPDMGIDLYLLGCLLQDVEGRMLQLLEKARSQKDVIYKEHVESTLDLSVRTTNILRRLNIKTVGDLLTYGVENLLKDRNFGRKSLIEVDSELEKIGLTLYTSEK